MLPIAVTTRTDRLPLATWTLILLNAVAFHMQLSLSPQELTRLFYEFGFVPARYSQPDWAMQVGLSPDDVRPLVTCMFLHAGWLHLLGNVWTLWLFGGSVESRMGSARFLLFYLVCGMAAAAVHSLAYPTSAIPTIGASGAIAGVLGAYLALFPGERVLVAVPVLIWPILLPMHAVVYLPCWFLLQLFNGVWALAGAEGVAGVAWWAHAGGFAAGLFACAFSSDRTRVGEDAASSRSADGKSATGVLCSPDRRPVAMHDQPRVLSKRTRAA